MAVRSQQRERGWERPTSMALGPQSAARGVGASASSSRRQGLGWPMQWRMTGTFVGLLFSNFILRRYVSRVVCLFSDVQI